jgi:hypothetical protein
MIELAGASQNESASPDADNTPITDVFYEINPVSAIETSYPQDKNKQLALSKHPLHTTGKR